MSRFHTILLIIVLMCLLISVSNAREIVHIPFKTPHDYWNDYLERAGNELWDDSLFFYPQIARMGATHVHEFHQSDYGNHYDLLKQCGLAIIAHPDASGDTFKVDQAMYRQWVFEDEFWNRGGNQYRGDFFSLDAKIGKPVFDGISDTPDRYTCIAGKHPAGYMFKDNALLPQYYDLGQRKYGFWLRIRKESHAEDDAKVCEIRITDPGIVEPIDTTFIITAQMLPRDEWHWAGGFIDKKFARRKIATRASLYWNGEVSASFDKIRFMDEFKYRLSYDPDSMRYWAACSSKFVEIVHHFKNDSRYLTAFSFDEPQYTTWEEIGHFRGKIKEWINNDDIMTYTNFKPWGPHMTKRALKETGNPVNMFDWYTLSWNTSHESKGDNSLQNAWNKLIDYGSHGTNRDYAGLRNGIERAAEMNIPFWFCMQTQGAIANLNREPTPAEIKCQGFLSMSFGVTGFMYYHYYPFYSGGFTALPDCTWIDKAAWRGAISRGLTDLWQSPGDSTIDSRSDFGKAFTSTGVLVPNIKWYAVQDFINYSNTIESLYTACEYSKSWCVTEKNPVGRVKINAVRSLKGRKDNPDESYVQVGVYNIPEIGEKDDHQAFMLVNRRCMKDETRIVDLSVSFGKNYKNLFLYDVARGNVISDDGGNSLRSEVTLAPGEGRLYLAVSAEKIPKQIDDGDIWKGLMVIDEPLVINSGDYLEIQPGSLIVFTDDGSLTIEGKIQTVGKSDAWITFTAMNSNISGIVKLNYPASAKLKYCEFTHLARGLEVSSLNFERLYLEKCTFTYNAGEGLHASGVNLILNDCEFTDNGEDGIHLYNSQLQSDNVELKRNNRN